MLALRKTFVATDANDRELFVVKKKFARKLTASQLPSATSLGFGADLHSLLSPSFYLILVQ